MKRATLIAGLLATSIGYASAPEHQPPTHEPSTHDEHAGKPAAKHVEPQSTKKDDAHHDEPKFNLDPREAMARLIDGNDRFRYGELNFPRFDQARRSETFANGQKPFAAILSCADSRAPVEAIFDQGIGDLFVIRVAGNVADSDEIGTIEYGVGHLGTGLIVVLGHTKCGAVTAVADGAKVHGHIAKLVDNIIPAVDAVKERDPDARGARLIRLSIRANVQQSMHDLLAKSQTISAAVKSGKAKVVGGVYDLQTGAIEWLGEHPQQAEILAAGADESSHDSHGELTHDKPAHDKPAKPDSHGKHDEHKSDQHDDHAKPAGKQSKAPAKPQKENWLALGGLLGASAAGSFATIHLLYGRK
jgi:carbonic anhydrase